jgi:hypothetical protein
MSYERAALLQAFVNASSAEYETAPKNQIGSLSLVKEAQLSYSPVIRGRNIRISIRIRLQRVANNPGSGGFEPST